MVTFCVLRKPGTDDQCQTLTISTRACRFTSLCVLANRRTDNVNWRTARAVLSVLCRPTKALATLLQRYEEQVVSCGYVPPGHTSSSIPKRPIHNIGYDVIKSNTITSSVDRTNTSTSSSKSGGNASPA